MNECNFVSSPRFVLKPTERRSKVRWQMWRSEKRNDKVHKSKFLKNSFRNKMLNYTFKAMDEERKCDVWGKSMVHRRMLRTHPQSLHGVNFAMTSGWWWQTHQTKRVFVFMKVNGWNHNKNHTHTFRFEHANFFDKWLKRCADIKISNNDEAKKNLYTLRLVILVVKRKWSLYQ